MDEYIIDQTLKSFERIEDALIQFSEHIPIIRENEVIKAPILIPHIVDACALIDSLLRDLTPDPVVIHGKSKKKRKCDISDFAELHAKNLDLPNTRSVLLVSPPSYRMPFKPWAKLSGVGDYPSLPWWQDYNALKHDRLVNIEKATLAIALDAACSLHQVITRRLDLIPILIRRGWFSCGYCFIDGVLEQVDKGALSDTFIVQTRLFATPVGKNQFPEDFKDLHPGLYQCKLEFIDFIGRAY